MPTWKKNIFVNAIKVRMTQESKTKEQVIADYVALSEIEKTEVLNSI